MPWQRKLGRPTDQRKAILRSLVSSTDTIWKIETTETGQKKYSPLQTN